MKRIAALAAWLLPLVLTPGASPGMMGAPARDGEVKAVSVVPAPGNVEVVIDLQGAVDVQDFTLASPARLVIDLTGARLTAPATLYDGQNRGRSEEHTSELQSLAYLVCRLLLEKKKDNACARS